MNNLNDANKQKIESVTRYEELEEVKKNIVKQKVRTAACGIAMVVGIIGKVAFPWMAFLGGVSVYQLYKLIDAIEKKAGIEKAIPLEEARKKALEEAQEDNKVENNEGGIKR